DGDVDVFVVSEDANELLNNDGDGTFRALAVDQGLAGAGGGRQVLAFDADADRDVDIAVLHDTPPHELYLNDRLWQYEPLAAAAFTDATAQAMTVGDADADGLAEMYLLDPDHEGLTVLRWDGDTLRPASVAGVRVAGARTLDLGDLDGDGRLEVLVAGTGGVRRFDAPALIEGTDAVLAPALGDDVLTALAVLASPQAGPGLAVVASDRQLRWVAPGAGRYPFVALALRGRESVADAMRSNAAGIGSRVALRRGEFWSTASTFGSHSAPGQSLQPISIGLGGVDTAQFVAIDWSDGVFQTELDLAAGRLHTIAETQRQLASCPVLFAWNGESYGFVTDLLGVGGIGFFLAPGEYGQPRPWERLLLDESQLRARNGEWVLKLTEPMEEVAYVDQLALEQVLVPPGWDVLIDERHSTDPTRAPTGALHWFREVLAPVAATGVDGTDVTASVRERDGRAAPVGARDDRFLGRLREAQALTLEFSARLGSQDGQARWLLADGWVEYPYSQTLFAAWQADVTYEAPSLEVSVDGVEWTTLAHAFGYPAGMPRQMALRLDGLPAGARYLRLTGNLEIYWDRLRVVVETPVPEGARVIGAPLRTARLSQVGFPKRITHEQRRPEFVYASRQAFWDTRYMRGAYTAFGDVLPLVEATDDALALVGAGEELHVTFEATTPALAPGWTRRYVLTTTGWAKDMDLYTRTGETVAPMPHRSQDPKALARRDALHARFHVRPLSGK
ncbi:MAG: VCBS repeat-containing protein, partial [Pseudomonadota bacterium]